MTIIATGRIATLTAPHLNFAGEHPTVKLVETNYGWTVLDWNKGHVSDDPVEAAGKIYSGKIKNMGDWALEVTESDRPIHHAAESNHNQLPSLEWAELYAAENRMMLCTLHLACDNGAHTSHRYGVVEAPAVGDDVSYAFNGDYYPCGTVTHVTKGSARVIKTDTGATFYRRRQTSCWKKKGGTWSLVQGHIKRSNPHF